MTLPAERVRLASPYMYDNDRCGNLGSLLEDKLNITDHHLDSMDHRVKKAMRGVPDVRYLGPRHMGIQ